VGNREEQEQRVIAAWIVAERELSIRVVAPFEFRAGAASYNCIAYLPDFGGPRGMLIEAFVPRKSPRNKALDRDAQAAGYYRSSISADVYQDFDRAKFQEALVDWGYYGPAVSRPQWLDEGNKPD
jgi:hypothetical protein